jgi:transcriptional regulator with XRE-family HTH domain
MTSEQLRALIERHHMTQSAFGELIGIAPRTARHFVERGITSVPTAILVTLLAQKKITIGDIQLAKRRLGV